MPFTFAHPAIILPFRYLPRKWYSMTGLVIGSMTPDFEYFLRMRIKSEYSHTIFGLFWLDLPLALILAFLYQNVVRISLLKNLPTALKARVLRFNGFNWNAYFRKHWPIVILSILIGAGSHLLWDAFTHHSGFFVQRVPFLSQSIRLFGMPVPVFKMLQHLSTVAGLLLIGLLFVKLPKSPVIEESSASRYWIVVGLLTLTILSVRVLLALKTVFPGDIVVSAISAFLLSLLAIGVSKIETIKG